MNHDWSCRGFGERVEKGPQCRKEDSSKHNMGASSSLHKAVTPPSCTPVSHCLNLQEMHSLNMPALTHSPQLTLDVSKVLSHAIIVNLPSSLSGEEVGHEGAGRGAVGIGAQRQVFQDLMGLPAELPEARVVHDLALDLMDGNKALSGKDVVFRVPPSQKNELDAPVGMCLCVGADVSAGVVPAWGTPPSSGSPVSWVQVDTGFGGARPALWDAALDLRADPRMGSIEVKLLELLKDEPLQGFRGKVS